MIAVEQGFDKVRELISALQELVEQGGRSKERADIVERGVFDCLLELGHEFMTMYFEKAGEGDQGETIERSDETLKRLEKKERDYHSIFGVIRVSRFVYAVREKKKAFAPLDEQLALPDVAHSYVLQDWLTRFCVKNSFDDSVASIRSLLGVKVSKRTVERLNEDLGTHVVPFRDSLPTEFRDDQEILTVSADGKGVPIRSTIEQRNGLPETAWQRHHRKKQEEKAEGRAKKRLSRGQMKSRKQMAYVGAVFSISPHVRTSSDILDEVVTKTPVNRPRPVNKRVQATMTNYLVGERINGQEVLFSDLARQVSQRNPESNKPLICLMDGQRSLWEQQREHLPQATPIIDIFHVSERLWEAAYCFHDEGSAEAEKMVCHYFRMLLDGKVDTVIRSFRAKKNSLSKYKKTILESIIKYYKNNRQYMKYAEYLQKGYPIGSGAIEGACRHLVKDRMEQTGMRWEIEGAQAMLNTRSAYINDEWDELIEYRIKKKIEENYGQAA